MQADVQNAIVRAAQEEGVDPSYALAVAERESSFNPNARSSKTIAGLFQMTSGLRRQYGSGDSGDPYTQAKAWMPFIKDVKGEMAQVLGRDPTDAETYAGHHFGSVRAARMMRMDPSTPVDQVFTPYEMSVNPHFARAGTVGNLNASVTSDITRRQAKFGGAEAPDLAEFGTPVEGNSLSKSDNKLPEPVDLSQYGTVASQGPDLPPAGNLKVASLDNSSPSTQTTRSDSDPNPDASSDDIDNIDATPAPLAPMEKRPPDLSAQGAPA